MHLDSEKALKTDPLFRPKGSAQSFVQTKEEITFSALLGRERKP